MKTILSNNQHLKILLLCLATQSGSLFAAWKNLCPDNLQCPAAAIHYAEPGAIAGNSNGVTLPYFSFSDNRLGESNKNITTRLAVYPDRVETPQWDAQIQPSGTFLQHSNGNWVAIKWMDQTFVLNPSGDQLYYQDHRIFIAGSVSILGPIIENENTLFYLKHGFLYSSIDAGLTWTETRNWNGLRIYSIYNNPFGSGLYAVGELTSTGGSKYGIFSNRSDPYRLNLI